MPASTTTSTGPPQGRHFGSVRRPTCPRAVAIALGLSAVVGWRAPALVAAQTVGSGQATTAVHADAGGRDAKGRCPLGVVGRIEIQNHSLFSRREIQGRPFAWALHVANWAHIRTRATYLRHELLFSEGSCYNPAAVRESVRLIRELPFISRVRDRATELGDSTWLIRVETWDEWTTHVSANFHVENQMQFTGGDVTEIDLLGRGLKAGVSYRRFRQQEDRSLVFDNPQFFGAHTHALVTAGTTRTGKSFYGSVSHPFVGELGRVSFDAHFGYDDNETPYITGGLGGVSHLLLPTRDRTAGLSFARRFGVPGALRMVGAEIDVLDRQVSGPVRQVVGGNYGGATPAPDSLAGVLGRQATPDSYVRIGVLAGLRRIHFTTRRGLDLVSGVQDVALGSELTLRLGRTVGTWHSSALGTWGSLDGYLAGAKGPFVGNVSLDAKARRLDAAPAGTSRWRDLGLIARAFGYFQPWASGLETLEGSVLFNGGWHSDEPYELTLGGQGGIRGYPDDQIPESTIMVGSLEERLNVPWLRPAVDLGFTLFGDTGMGWADGIPFAHDTGWLSSIGGGIRFGFPAGTHWVERIEMAWPVSGPSAGGSPVFRIYWSKVETLR